MNDKSKEKYRELVRLSAHDRWRSNLMKILVGITLSSIATKLVVSGFTTSLDALIFLAAIILSSIMGRFDQKYYLEAEALRADAEIVLVEAQNGKDH